MEYQALYMSRNMQRRGGVPRHVRRLLADMTEVGEKTLLGQRLHSESAEKADRLLPKGAGRGLGWEAPRLSGHVPVSGKNGEAGVTPVRILSSCAGPVGGAWCEGLRPAEPWPAWLAARASTSWVMSWGWDLLSSASTPSAAPRPRGGWGSVGRAAGGGGAQRSKVTARVATGATGRAPRWARASASATTAPKPSAEGAGAVGDLAAAATAW